MAPSIRCLGVGAGHFRVATYRPVSPGSCLGCLVTKEDGEAHVHAEAIDLRMELLFPHHADSLEYTMSDTNIHRKL